MKKAKRFSIQEFKFTPFYLVFAVGLTFSVLHAQATTPFRGDSRIDDSDLTNNRTLQDVQIPSGDELTPTSVITEPKHHEKLTLLQFRRKKGEALLSIAGLPVSINGKEPYYTDQNGNLGLESCPAGAVLNAESKLQSNRIQIRTGGFAGTVYTIRYSIRCDADQTFVFESEKPEGQATTIWHVGQTAYQKLNQSVDLNFWKSVITFAWPSNGDYYNFNTVHITRGDYWDVVGHELGHAIYDQAKIGGMQGGQHKIDECYSGTLALSEGWASYFSAWLSVGLDDADAKFEFLVPRRAPIRFENIPTDVCTSEKNEWRVTGFFWDLVDLNSDGEEITETFGKVWNSLLGKRISTTSEAIPHLQNAGFEQHILALVWVLNFLENPTAGKTEIPEWFK